MLLAVQILEHLTASGDAPLLQIFLSIQGRGLNIADLGRKCGGDDNEVSREEFLIHDLDDVAYFDVGSGCLLKLASFHD